MYVQRNWEERKKKQRGAAKKSVVVEADSDFEEFSPEDLG